MLSVSLNALDFWGYTSEVLTDPVYRKGASEVAAGCPLSTIRSPALQYGFGFFSEALRHVVAAWL
jgi:hypothetical protein